MTPATFALLCLAGGLGAGARFLGDEWIRGRTALTFPLGTFLINVSGSLALGLVMSLGDAGVLGSAMVGVLGAGFLGGFTTLSTASVETMRLALQRRPGLAVGYAAATLLAASGAAALGILMGRLAAGT